MIDPEHSVVVDFANVDASRRAMILDTIRDMGGAILSVGQMLDDGELDITRRPTT
jgi:hypothetical protein